MGSGTDWAEVSLMRLHCSMGKAFVWYFETLIINAWSAVPGTRQKASLLVFGVSGGGSF